VLLIRFKIYYYLDFLSEETRRLAVGLQLLIFQSSKQHGRKHEQPHRRLRHVEEFSEMGQGQRGQFAATRPCNRCHQVSLTIIWICLNYSSIFLGSISNDLETQMHRVIDRFSPHATVIKP